MRQGMNTLKWRRRVPESGNNFDLVLSNPQDLDSRRIESLLACVLGEKHRGQQFNSKATKEFRLWLDNPSSPLKSTAYVPLSNWFMTRSGDRNSMLASRCEGLWDALFPCRPLERLSSPEPGKNHIVLPSEFVNFWRRLMSAQWEAGNDPPPPSAEPIENRQEAASARIVERPTVSTEFPSDQIKARFNSKGLQFELEGSAAALAEFLRKYGESTTEESK